MRLPNLAWRCLLVGLVSLGCGGSREPWRKTATTTSPEAGGAGSSSQAAAGSNPGGMTAVAAGARSTASAGSAGADAASNGSAGSISFECSGDDYTNLPGLRTTGASIGAAVSNGRLAETAYQAAAAREFNSLTPENEMKWTFTEPNPGEFTFDAADALVAFAEKNQMVVRGHTLVWHNQLPDWVKQLPDADSLRGAMQRHIETVMAHFRDKFPGRVVAWDVVNEAFDSGADADGNTIGTFRNSVFYQKLGSDFIAEAFRIARAVDPKVKLYYNDFGIEGTWAKPDFAFATLRSLVEQGVPIDGVGFQMHVPAADWGPSLEEFQANLARYAAAGLAVNISEMDASICYADGTLDERIQVQRSRIYSIARACLRAPNCRSITVWGIGDSDSWLTNSRPCNDTEFSPMPLLFDQTYKRKPAWAGLWDALVGCER